MSSDNKTKNSQKHNILNITIDPKKLFLKLLYCIGFLVFANIIGIISKLAFSHHYCYGLIPMFDFDAEMNFPTFEGILEMLGIAIFIYTLLSYMSEQFKSFSISVKMIKVRI